MILNFKEFITEGEDNLDPEIKPYYKELKKLGINIVIEDNFYLTLKPSNEAIKNLENSKTGIVGAFYPAGTIPVLDIILI